MVATVAAVVFVFCRCFFYFYYGHCARAWMRQASSYVPCDEAVCVQHLHICACITCVARQKSLNIQAINLWHKRVQKLRLFENQRQHVYLINKNWQALFQYIALHCKDRFKPDFKYNYNIYIHIFAVAPRTTTNTLSRGSQITESRQPHYWIAVAKLLKTATTFWPPTNLRQGERPATRQRHPLLQVETGRLMLPDRRQKFKWNLTSCS